MGCPASVGALAAISDDGNRITSTGQILGMVVRQCVAANGITGDDKDDLLWGLENVKKIGAMLKKMGVPEQR